MLTSGQYFFALTLNALRIILIPSYHPSCLVFSCPILTPFIHSSPLPNLSLPSLLITFPRPFTPSPSFYTLLSLPLSLCLTFFSPFITFPPLDISPLSQISFPTFSSPFPLLFMSLLVSQNRSLCPICLFHPSHLSRHTFSLFQLTSLSRLFSFCLSLFISLLPSYLPQLPSLILFFSPQPVPHPYTIILLSNFIPIRL